MNVRRGILRSLVPQTTQSMLSNSIIGEAGEVELMPWPEEGVDKALLVSHPAQRGKADGVNFISRRTER